MAIDLRKGQATSLDIYTFNIGLGWDVNVGNNTPFDLDVSAFMLNRSKQLPADEYLVFYNSDQRVMPDNVSRIVLSSNWAGHDANERMRHESHPVDPELSVIGSIDDEDGETSDDGDDETMTINLTRVRSDVQEIIITASIYEHEARRQNFGQVDRAYIRIYRVENGREVEKYRYDLTEDFSNCTAVEFCRLYRQGNGWKIEALGNGLRGGLEELVRKYQNL
jgi:tellurium resistance protein TerD